MSSSQFRFVCAAAALTAALIAPVLPSAAHAGDPDDYASVQSRVYIPHVDFSDPAQVKAVYHRLKAEARNVCDQAASYAYNYTSSAERDCEAEALVGAVRDIHQPQLSRLDDEAHGKAPVELSLNSPQR